MGDLGVRAIPAGSVVALLLAAALGGCEQHHQPPPANILGTYAKNCSIPPANWRKLPANAGDRMWAIIRLDASGHTTWNAQPTRSDILREYLHQFEGPAAALAFVSAPDAKCADVQKARLMMLELAMCRRAGQCVEGDKNLPPPVA